MKRFTLAGAMPSIFAVHAYDQRNALVAFGQGVAKMSGKIGGTVFAHNSGGSYARNWSVPTDPQTAAQVAVRTAMTTLSVAFVETLTQAQRDGWDVYGQNVSRKNRLGETIFLSGISWFVGCNVPRLQIGIATTPQVDDAPVLFDRGEFTAPTISSWVSANDEVLIAFDNTDLWANEDESSMAIYASRPQNDSKQFFKGPYRLAATIDGDAITAPTSPATLTLPFAIEDGQKVFFRAVVTRADGRLSSAVTFSGIVA